MINTNVRSIRLAKGISGSHVAKAIGITPAGYYAIETGKVELKAEHLKTISSILGENAEVFFDEKLTESVLERIRGVEIV